MLDEGRDGDVWVGVCDDIWYHWRTETSGYLGIQLFVTELEPK